MLQPAHRTLDARAQLMAASRTIPQRLRASSWRSPNPSTKMRAVRARDSPAGPRALKASCAL